MGKLSEPDTTREAGATGWSSQLSSRPFHRPACSQVWRSKRLPIYLDIDLQIQAMLHRNYIYEDAFDKLSPDNEANLRLKMRVQLVNAAGRERIYFQRQWDLHVISQVWTKLALMEEVYLESSSASCSRLPLILTEDSSHSLGTKCSIQGNMSQDQR